ncbi:YceD family protein [Roseococcus suduntuyensis]|uniref:Uncharacterized metal-binding protein YceD (DUF177 family) n=1 Tax=Roseococcus suduntuyensis TaxID=455361 RepID=A0A840AH03_9PROT|nr:DUF177 domain-containing protein [Roseococcus suduntuyensis]MBB3900287.1 uncharacterized metal-binding protein YceD (DUF177 family) [Roseococcus suduntuyensis]
MTPEFPHPLVLAHVPAGGQRLRLVADAAQCAALARRMGILAVHALVAELDLRPAEEGRIAVRGRLSAEVEQECVVSLEPVRQNIAEDIAWRLLPDGMEPTDGDDDPDDIESAGGVVDLGEAVAQQLSLALDPYPRAPNAQRPDDPGAGGAHGPFAMLARLKRPG